MKASKALPSSHQSQATAGSKPETSGGRLNYEEDEENEQLARKLFNTRYALNSPDLERLESGFGAYSQQEEGETESEAEEEMTMASEGEMTSSEEEYKRFLESERVKEEALKAQAQNALETINQVIDSDLEEYIAEEESKTELSSDEEEDEDTDEELANFMSSGADESSCIEKEENDFDKDQYYSELEQEESNSDQFSFTSMPENGNLSRTSETSRPSAAQIETLRNSEEEELLILKKIKKEEKKAKRKQKGEKSKKRKKKRKITGTGCQPPAAAAYVDEGYAETSLTKTMAFVDNSKDKELGDLNNIVQEVLSGVEQHPYASEEDLASIQRFSVNTSRIEEYESDVYERGKAESDELAEEPFPTVEAYSDSSSGSYDLLKFRLERSSEGRYVIVTHSNEVKRSKSKSKFNTEELRDHASPKATSSDIFVTDKRTVKALKINNGVLSDVREILQTCVEDCFRLVSKSAKQPYADNVGCFDIGLDQESVEVERTTTPLNKENQEETFSLSLEEELVSVFPLSKADRDKSIEVRENGRRESIKKQNAKKTLDVAEIRESISTPGTSDLDFDFFSMGNPDCDVDVSVAQSDLERQPSVMLSLSDKVDYINCNAEQSSPSSIPESYKLNFDHSLHCTLLKSTRNQSHTHRYQTWRCKVKRLHSKRARNVIYARAHPGRSSQVRRQGSVDSRPDSELPSYKNMLAMEKQKQEAVAEVLEALWSLVSIEIEVLDIVGEHRKKLQFTQEILADLVDQSCYIAIRKQAYQKDEDRTWTIHNILQLVIDRAIYESTFRTNAVYEKQVSALAQDLVEAVLSTTLCQVLNEEMLTVTATRNALGRALLRDGNNMKDVVMLLWKIFHFHEPISTLGALEQQKKYMFTWKRRTRLYHSRRKNAAELHTSFSDHRSLDQLKESSHGTGNTRNSRAEEEASLHPLVELINNEEMEVSCTEFVAYEQQPVADYLTVQNVEEKASSLGSQSVSAYEEKNVVSKEYHASKLQGSKNAPTQLTREVLNTLPEAKKGEYIKLWLVQNETHPLPPLSPKPHGRNVLAGRRRRFTRQRPQTVLSEHSDATVSPADAAWLLAHMKGTGEYNKARPETASVYTGRESPRTTGSSSNQSDISELAGVKTDFEAEKSPAESFDKHIFDDNFFEIESEKEEKNEGDEKLLDPLVLRFDRMVIQSPLPARITKESANQLFYLVQKQEPVSEEQRKEKELVRSRKMSLLSKDVATKGNFYLTNLQYLEHNLKQDQSEADLEVDCVVEEILEEEDRRKASDCGYSDGVSSRSAGGASDVFDDCDSYSVHSFDSSEVLEPEAVDDLKDPQLEDTSLGTPLLEENIQHLSAEHGQSTNSLHRSEQGKPRSQGGSTEMVPQSRSPHQEVKSFVSKPEEKQATTRQGQWLIKRARPIINWKTLQPVLSKDLRKEYYARSYITINKTLFRDLSIQPVKLKRTTQGTSGAKQSRVSETNTSVPSERNGRQRNPNNDHPTKRKDKTKQELRESTIKETIERLTYSIRRTQATQRNGRDANVLPSLSARSGGPSDEKRPERSKVRLPRIDHNYQGIIAASAEPKTIRKLPVT